MVTPHRHADDPSRVVQYLSVTVGNEKTATLPGLIGPLK
jgi:hypothetical protein